MRFDARVDHQTALAAPMFVSDRGLDPSMSAAGLLRVNVTHKKLPSDSLANWLSSTNTTSGNRLNAGVRSALSAKLGCAASAGRLYDEHSGHGDAGFAKAVG